MISVRYLICSAQVLSLFPKFFSFKLFVLLHPGFAMSEKRGVVLLSFLKFLTLPGLEQGSMREQEVLYLSHVVEAGFVFSRNGQCLNLAFSWGTFVGSSEICTPLHIRTHTLDLGKYTFLCQLLSSSIAPNKSTLHFQFLCEKPFFCSHKL